METVPVQIIDYADDLDEREAIIEFNRQREKTFSQKMAENLQSRTSEPEKRLEEVSSENDQLKRIVAEKELELAILRELRDKTNPR